MPASIRLHPTHGVRSRVPRVPALRCIVTPRGEGEPKRSAEMYEVDATLEDEREVPRAPGVRAASREDVARIVGLLAANRNDPSMFLRSQSDVAAREEDFLVAVDERHLTVGCAALHQHRPWLAELLSVAVDPSLHGAGIGSALVRECLGQAAQQPGLEQVFLATSKPEYFARFGFEPVSKWLLPGEVLVDKLTKVLAQPIRRWIPALVGRHTFMLCSVRSTREAHGTERGRDEVDHAVR